jgi:hypothetical protein
LGTSDSCSFVAAQYRFAKVEHGLIPAEEQFSLTKTQMDAGRADQASRQVTTQVGFGKIHRQPKATFRSGTGVNRDQNVTDLACRKR